MSMYRLSNRFSHPASWKNQTGRQFIIEFKLYNFVSLDGKFEQVNSIGSKNVARYNILRGRKG